MVDIATVSVVSSALVALGTIAVNFIGGERQRSHEAGLDFEKRVWERKSESLFAVIQECRALLDADEPLVDETRTWWALGLSRHLDALRNVRSTVEAFASARCRVELTELVDAMSAQGVKEYLGHRVDRYNKLMLEVPFSDTYSTQDIQKEVAQRNRYREWIKETEDEALVDFAPDLVDIHERAARLLEAARESVRRPND